MSIFELFKEQAFFKIDPDSARKAQEKLPALYTQCVHCKEPVNKEQLKNAHAVCPHCEFHHPVPVSERMKFFFDKGRFSVLDAGIRSVDVLAFKDEGKDYAERLKKYQAEGLDQDAFISARGTMNGLDIHAGFFTFKFLGGSMGSVVGEKVCRLFESALSHNQPVVIFHESGGARMQEGLFSLYQMGKTSMVLSRFKKLSKHPYISVLCYPTTGGVAASFAVAGDVNIAEKDALVGFAGKRVIQKAISRPLPDDFQTADYVLQKGMVDMVVHRHDLRDTIHQLLLFLRTQDAQS